ncbi:hypothetical protein DEJ01_09800 [Curtobacterium sp. MCLR17_040]|uniref:hypothetical protein n=1 Tax=Curtobacterium sp. MCLR17_040 TaxID=2175625 RepID=UPI000DAA4F37|nr:hypothetical protein [Curtobacterium sp. MCLR17_040]PZF02811.1 hypothetical protein DEJ01_09800 [Curtobacterium sp. MCLR17_040]
MANIEFVPDGAAPASFIIPADVSSIVGEDEQWASTELVIAADPTIVPTATAAGYRDRSDDIITANTLLRADTRTDDDTKALNEVRNRLWFLADTGYDLRWNLPS